MAGGTRITVQDKRVNVAVTRGNAPAVNIAAGSLTAKVEVRSAGGATNLNGLTDVVLTSPANLDVLYYDNVSGTWKNSAQSIIDHTLLSNIGIATHDDIDLHIGDTDNPHSVTAAQVAALALNGSNAMTGAINTTVGTLSSSVANTVDSYIFDSTIAKTTGALASFRSAAVEKYRIGLGTLGFGNSIELDASGVNGIFDGMHFLWGGFGSVRFSPAAGAGKYFEVDPTNGGFKTDNTVMVFFPGLVQNFTIDGGNDVIFGKAGSTTDLGTTTTRFNDLFLAGAIDAVGNIQTDDYFLPKPAVFSRDKYRMYSSTNQNHAIGFDENYTFGGLASSAITFQMANANNQGFWWGDISHTNAQGAMSLTTQGKLSLAHSIRVGYGEADVIVPGIIHDIDASGSIHSNSFFLAKESVFSRDKIRMYSSNVHVIGFDDGYTFGALNNGSAITFQMNNDNIRGFWWGDVGHTNAQGAMALSTDGKLTLAHSMRLGYGESDTVIPGATYLFDVNGKSYMGGAVTLKAGTATAGTAPLYFTSGALLTTPEPGTMEYLDGHFYFTDADRYGMVGSSGVKTTTTTVANTTTPGTIYTYTFPANALHEDMKVVFDFNGVYSTNTGSESITIDFKFNGVTQFTHTLTPGNVTNKAWEGCYCLTTRTSGASGTFVDFFKFLEGGTSPVMDASPSTTSIDTTVDIDFDVVVTWGGTGASNSFSCIQGDLSFRH